MLLYYKAKVMIENANKGIFDYFDTNNCGYLIADEPRLARETLEDKTIRTTSGRRRRGFTPSKIVKLLLKMIGFLEIIEKMDKKINLIYDIHSCPKGLNIDNLFNIMNNSG